MRWMSPMVASVGAHRRAAYMVATKLAAAANAKPFSQRCNSTVATSLHHFQGYCITKRDAVILSAAKDLLFFAVSNPLREKQILRAPESRDPQNDVIGGNGAIHQR